MVAKGNVLVVDDEVNLCRILSAKLARSGYDVVTVHDGLHAVERIRNSAFDVVLLDLILPHMDGLAALKEIRKYDRELPVIIMTACENNEALENARTEGVTACLNKPFDLDKLVALVSDAAKRHAGGGAAESDGNTVLFAKGQKVILELHNGRIEMYECTIVDKGDRTLTVTKPKRGDAYRQILPRTAIKVGVGTADAYYHFTTHIIDGAESPEGTMTLEKPSVICRSQRRQHQRFTMNIPVEYAVYDDESEAEPQMRIGYTQDISLGGAKLLVDEEISAGEVISIKLRPKEDGDEIDTMAYVVRVTSEDLEGEEKYILGCRFSRSDEDALDELLQD